LGFTVLSAFVAFAVHSQQAKRVVCTALSLVYLALGCMWIIFNKKFSNLFEDGKPLVYAAIYLIFGFGGFLINVLFVSVDDIKPKQI
jgi:hypothetical protein